MSIILDNITSLNQLFSGDRLIREKSIQRELKLHFAELSSKETKYWESRINRHYSACGCLQGSIAIILALGCFFTYLFLRPSEFLINWLDGTKALVLFIASGAIGKIMGLKLSKRHLRKTILELKCVLQDNAKKTKRPFPKNSTHIKKSNLEV